MAKAANTPTYAIGVDVGATKIAAALVDGRGQLLHEQQTPTAPERGTAAILDDLAALVADLQAAAPVEVAGLGIGTPGQVSSDTGVVRNAVNLGWEEVALVAEVRARLATELPIWIQKDANAAALGEYYFGAARRIDDFVYLGVGSGLGGGIVAGGRLVTGAQGNAAEVGHLVLDPAGHRCACGQKGCAETVVSGPGLLHLVRSAPLGRSDAEGSVAGQPTGAAFPPAGNTRLVLKAAAAGDARARAALTQVGEGLGRIMAACVALLNPALIVVGGGLGLAAYQFLLPAARAELARRVLAGSLSSLAIKRSQVASSAVGAAGLVWYFREGGEAIG